MKYYKFKNITLSVLFLLSSYILNKRKSIPKLSIFLPIFNMQYFLKTALNSVLKQTLKDIEIIAINDNSNDKSYEILKEYAFLDKRIKIINNTKNRGLLYSRAIGILHSSGEYLLNLDPDDQFNDFDNLRYLYFKAKRTNVDIVAYPFLRRSTNKIYLPCDELDVIIKQPKLFENYLRLKETMANSVIWNKLIKREIYLKAFKIYKDYIYNKKWNYHEDDIWNLLIHKFSSSKICIKKLIYKYNNNINKRSIMNNRGLLIEYINYVYRFEMTRKFLNDHVYLNHITYECESLIKAINDSEIFISHIQKNGYLKNITIYNSQICLKFYNISKKYKNIIFNLFNITQLDN